MMRRHVVWISALLTLAIFSMAAASPSVLNTESRVMHSRKALRRRRGTRANAATKSSKPFRTEVSEQADSKNLVSVKAVLVPRNVNVPRFIRFLSTILFVGSFMGCLQTKGVPHARAIWSLIQKDRSSKMPNDYIPGGLDLLLASTYASAYKEMLPPLFLPSVGPLLGVFMSIFIYVGVTILLPRWFTSFRVFMFYRSFEPTKLSANNPVGADVLVQLGDDYATQDLSNADTGKHHMVICPLHRCEETLNDQTLDAHYAHLSSHYFELNQCRFYFDPTAGRCIDGGPSLHMASMKFLQKASQTGLSKSQRTIVKQRYGPYNRPQLASPTVLEAFYARISSPLVVVQMIGRLFAILEEGPSSVLNLAVTLSHHYVNAHQAILSTRQLAQEVQASVKETSNVKVWVLRDSVKRATGKQWRKSTAAELLPGDVFVMSKIEKNEMNLVVPVDAVVLSGQCLTNEAVLTGESVPQNKVPIDFEEQLVNGDDLFDMQGYRQSMLFAGTSIIHFSSDMGIRDSGTNLPSLPKAASSGLVCFALRTGTYSSKGELLRALKSSSHVGAISNPQSEKDAMLLISSLSLCAVASCLSIFMPRGGETQRHVSVFRRIVQCTRIAVASIPSDLPLTLSAVAQQCSHILRQESDVVCSEPGSLLTAAHVDVVVFDKVRVFADGKMTWYEE